MPNPEVHGQADLTGALCRGVRLETLIDRARSVNRCAHTAVYSMPSAPFHAQHIEVAPGRSIYVEQFGSLRGAPLLYLHGGLCMTLRLENFGYIDPAKVRIISLHQRGAGRSSAVGELREHSTQNLVQDVETVRQALQVDSWHVYGHSFGATPALLYGCEHSARTRSLTLHGAFLPGGERTAAFYAGELERLPSGGRVRTAQFEGARGRELFSRYADAIAGASGDERDCLLRTFWELGPNERVTAQKIDYTRLMLWYRSNDYFLPESWLDDALASIACAVQLVHSAEDEVITIGSSVQMAGALPAAGLSLALGSHFYREAMAQYSLRRIFDRRSWE